MTENRVQMPQSGGGIVRYFDEYKSKIELSPKIVIALIVFIAVLEIILHQMNFLGL